MPHDRVRANRLVGAALVASFDAGAAEALGGLLAGPGQQLVNQTTTSYQGEPDVEFLEDDGFVVVWTTNGQGIWSRAFYANGMVNGDEVQVSASGISHPRVERLTDDRLIVVWDDGFDVFGRFLTAAGAPTGAEIPLNQETTGSQSDADVAAASNGGFLVAWESTVSNGGDASAKSVQARLFDADGDPLIDDLQVNTTTSGQQAHANVAALDGGAFAVVWDSLAASGGGDVDGFSVQLQRIAANGAPLGSEIQANSGTAGDQQDPDVTSLPGGGFAVAWNSVPPSAQSELALGAEGVGAFDGIQVRLFRADGTAEDAELTVSVLGGASSAYPTIASGPDGFLVAAWEEGAEEIAARLLLPHPLEISGNVVQVDDLASTGTSYSRLALDGRDGVMVAWESYGSPGGDGSDGSVQVRRMSVGRVAHWKLDEGAGTNAADSAGQSSDDGTLSSAANWSWGRPGGRKALAFDGDDLVSLPTSSDLDVTLPGVSLEAWVWLEELPSAIGESFQSIYDSAQDNYVLYLDRVAAELRFKVTDSSGTVERPGIAEADLDVHRWMHVVGVYDASGEARVYLDGELRDTHVNALLVDPVRSSPSQQAAMGRDGANTQYWLKGRIERVAVWQKALDPGEIRFLGGGWIFGDGFEIGDKSAWTLSTP